MRDFIPPFVLHECSLESGRYFNEILISSEPEKVLDEIVTLAVEVIDGRGFSLSVPAAFALPPYAR